MLEIFTRCIRLFLYYTHPVLEKILDVLYSIFAGEKKSLPAIKNSILLMSAAELAEAIRKRKLTSEEVVKVYIQRIKEVNSIINACVDERYLAAIEDAKFVDKMLEDGSKTEAELKTDMPLLGVPFTCKEIIGVKGLAQTMGLKRFKDRKAPVDAAAVALYRQAGAIPLVVTNIPTLSLGWSTSNHLFGMTYNPYNSHRMVGGSSGGEAAVLASAGAIIGMGTDIGGSIRIPGAFCGIYGHKPSRGIVSNSRPNTMTSEKLDRFQGTGPMCRYVADLPLLLKVLCGKDINKLSLEEKVDFKNVRVFYIETFPGWLPASEGLKNAIRKAVKHFTEEFNVKPIKLRINELTWPFDIWQCKLLEADDSPILADITYKNGNINWPWQFLKSFLRISEYDIRLLHVATILKHRKDKHYYDCLKLYEVIERKLEECLRNDAILLLPTLPERPPHCIMSMPKIYDIGYVDIFNILGLPATQIPAGFSKDLPIGIQAVAGHYKDHLTLAAAAELDKVFGGWKSPCPILI